MAPAVAWCHTVSGLPSSTPASRATSFSQTPYDMNTTAVLHVWATRAGVTPAYRPRTPAERTIDRRQLAPVRCVSGDICIVTRTVSSQCVVYVAVPPPATADRAVRQPVAARGGRRLIDLFIKQKYLTWDMRYISSTLLNRYLTNTFLYSRLNCIMVLDVFTIFTGRQTDRQTHKQTDIYIILYDITV